jgi:AsmA protein
MKPIKLAAIALGLLAVLVLGLAAFLFVSFDAARIKAELASMVHEKTQRTLKIDGELALSFWPNVGVRVGKASLSEFRGDTEFIAIDGARVAVALLPLLSKQVMVREIELDGARVTLVKRKDGSLNIDNLTKKEGTTPEAAAPGKAAAAPMKIDIAAIRIADAHLTWRDEQSGRTTTVSGLDFSTGRIIGDPGRQGYDIDGLKLGLKGTSDTDSVALRLEMPRIALAGDEARTLTIEKIGGGIDIASPKMPMKSLRLPIDGRLQASLAKQTAQGTLSTRFDESNIALKFDVTRFSPLALGFDLDIDRLNVDKYLPPAKSAEASKAEAGGDGGQAGKEGRIDLSALKGLDLRGIVHVGQFQISNVKASDVRLKLALAGGKLNVTPHSMNLYGGRLDGTLSVNADGNVVAMRENLVGVSINPLMKDLADKDLIEGHGDVRLDISTRGNTVAAMKKALGGSAAVALRDGAIKGINLAQSFREAKALISGKQDAIQQARISDKTDFTEMTASFRITNGVARNDDLAAKSPFLRLGGSGDIDIGNGRLDYLAKASVVGTSGGQGAKGLDQLQGVTIPVRATGPFDKLSYKIEYGAIAEGALKAKVDEKKEELKQRAKDELLKGLFGK